MKNRVGEIWDIRGQWHVCLGEDPTNPRLYELAVLAPDGNVGSPRPHGRSVYVSKLALDEPAPKRWANDWWKRIA